MRIVGLWCSTTCTEAKDTLDSVPIWFIELLCILCRCLIFGSLPFQPPPSFLRPTLVRLCRHRCHLPCPCRVNYHMLPPPHTHTYPPLPLHSLSQVHNWLRRNILLYRILPSPNVCFHRLKPRLLSLCLR